MKRLLTLRSHRALSFALLSFANEGMSTNPLLMPPTNRPRAVGLQCGLLSLCFRRQPDEVLLNFEISAPFDFQHVQHMEVRGNGEFVVSRLLVLACGSLTSCR